MRVKTTSPSPKSISRPLLALLVVLGAAAPVPGQVAAPPGGWVDRPDDMVQFWLWDMDRLGDRLRVLYSTSPSLEQGQSADWTVNVYLVEMTADGTITQHRLASEQKIDHVSLALRRGHGEVFVQRNAEDPSDGTRLDMLSVPDGTVVSSIAVPSPTGPGGEPWDWDGFRVPTMDGNVVFTTRQQATGASGATVSTAAWFELTPEGAIAGRDAYTVEGDRVAVTGWFPAPGGGLGLVLDLSAGGDDGIASEIETPIERQIGGRTIEAVVYGEKRLLLTDTDATTAWLSPALQRDLLWRGAMAIPQDLPAAQRIEQSNAQMRLTETVELEYGGRRELMTVIRGRNRIDRVRPTGSGYGVLATVTANRRRVPPVHGPYFIELSREEGVRREIYLNPLAEGSDLEFVDFVAGANDAIYLLGRERYGSGALDGQVLWLESDGSRRAVPISGSGPYRVELDGMVGGISGVWVVGHGMDPDSRKTSLWVQRVDLGS